MVSPFPVWSSAFFTILPIASPNQSRSQKREISSAPEHRPGQYNALLLSGKLWTYLADLNEQAADRLACIVSQMQEAEGVTEELKARDQLAWVGGMKSIRSRAEEIILSEMIFV